MVTCSAILINYNHSAYIVQALDAALNQTVPFDEVVIVDDASTDESVSIIAGRIRDVPRARLIQNPENTGVIAALNAGTRAATGDFIFWMSADDSYSLHIVEWSLEALKRYPDAAMVSGNTRICNSATDRERAFTLPFAQKMACHTRRDLEALAGKRVITFFGGANCIRRDAVTGAGGYLTSLKWHADWFLYVLVACRYPFAVVPHEYVRVRQSSNQYSHACYDWKQQKPVIEAFVRLLKSDYPAEYGFFRTAALLPTYDLETLPLLLKDATLRHYLTPLLVWRLLTYKPLRTMGRRLPDGVRAALRKLMRV